MANTINFNIKTTSDLSGLNKLKKELDEIRRLAMDTDYTAGFSPAEINKMVDAANNLERALDSAFDFDFNTINIEKFNKILKQSGTNIGEIEKDLNIAGYTGQRAFSLATTELLKLNNVTTKTNTLLTKMAQTMGNTIKWGITSSLWNNITGSIQKSFYYIKDLDTAMNDIRIVTEKSAEDMAKFAIEANNAAKALATSTQDYSEGSLIYYQQGLDDTTVRTLTDITAKTSNVTGQSMETVSEQLTAVWNGYRVANQAAEEGMGVYQEYVDKMAAVGAATASDLEELATGMSKVASAAASMGVDFDDLNAQIATIVSVTRQAPESVGTALKTIYARLGDLKIDGVDEFGTSLGEVSGQLLTMGVNVLDQEGNLRNMSEVITEVASKWDTWTESQKQAAAVAMAGKRQYNNLIALFDNWDMYTDALITSQNALGTLEKQNDVALESMKNKMEVLSATAEDLYGNLFDEESIINGTEGLTDVIQLLANMTEAVGGLDDILIMIGSVGASVFSKQIANGIGNSINNLRLFIDSTKKAQENLANAKAMFDGKSQLAMFGNGKDPATATQQENLNRTLQIYENIISKEVLMNEEEKKRAISLQEAVGNLNLLNVEFEYNSQILLEAGQRLGLYTTNLEEIPENVEEQTRKLKELQDRLQNIVDTSENLSENDIKSVLNSFTRGSKGIFDFKELNKAKGLFGIFRKEIKECNGDTAKLEATVQKFVNNLSNIDNVSQDVIKVRNKMHELEGQVDSLSDSLKKNLNFKESVQGVVQALGALGQLATTVRQFSNIPKIISNEDLTNGEKAIEVITALTFGVSMLGNAIAELTKIKTIEFALDKIKSGFNLLYILELNRIAQAHGIDAAAATMGMKAKAGFTASIGLANKALTKLAGALGISTAAAGALVAVIGVAIIATVAITKAIKKKREETIADAKATIEVANATQEEIKANEELCDSYLKVFEAYENNKASKEDIAEETEKLIGIIDREDAAIARLTGDYSKLTDKVRKYQIEQAQKGLNAAKEEKGSAEDLIRIAAKDGRGRQLDDGGYWLEFNGAGKEDKILDVLEKTVDKKFQDYSNADFFSSTFRIVTDDLDTATLVQLYDELNQAKLDIIENTTAAERNESGAYADMVEWLDKMKESVEQYKQAIQDIETYNIQIKGLNNGIQDATNIEEFAEKREQLIEDLGKTIPSKSREEIENMVDTWISQQGEAINTLADKNVAFNFITRNLNSKEAKDDIRKFIEDLNDEDLGVLTAHMEFSRATSVEALKTEIEFFKEYLKREKITASIDITVDAQSKLLKGEVLDKETLTALKSSFDSAGIEFNLDIFNAKNRGDQIEMLAAKMRELSEATKNAYENNEKYEKDLQESKDKNELELKKARIRRDNILASMEKGATGLTAQLASAEADIARLEAEAANLSNITFQTEFEAKLQQHSSSVNAVVTEVTALKNATDTIGESFIVASEDAQLLADLYPELFKNSQVLADGRIQLDEKVAQNYLKGVEATYEKSKELAERELITEINLLQAKTTRNQATQAEKDLLGQLIALYASLNSANLEFLNEVGKVNQTIQDNAEIDRYYDINVSIKNLENSLSKLKKQQDSLVGTRFIDSLKKENALLETINSQYKNKQGLLTEEAKELSKSLAEYGVIIQNGIVTNYADIWNKLNDEVIKNQEDEVAKHNFDNFEKQIERFTSITTEEIPSLAESIADNLATQVNNNLKTWEIKFEKGLDLTEWEDSIDEFLDETSRDFTKVFTKDLAKIVNKNPFKEYIEDIDRYLNPNSKGLKSLENIRDLFAEIEKINKGGTSEMFGTSVEAAADYTKEKLQEAIDQAQSIFETYESAYEDYIDTIGEANELLDAQRDKLERINSQLEFNAQWVELIYGADAYAMMSMIYDTQIDNSLATVAHLKEETKLWEQKYLAEEEGSAARQEYYDLWVEAQDELNGKVVEHIELLKNDYANTISQTIAKLEKDLTGGLSFDRLSDEWDRQKKHSDKYLDNVEGMYEIQTLANKINQDISDTSSVKNQQKLQAIYDKEIKNLREKDNLTKHDIEMAEKRYDIALKEMALEDARNAKNSIKMMRDASGNWSYQYVADTEKVASAQSDLSNSYQDLYQSSKDAYEENIESMLELKQSFLDSLKEIYEDDTMNEAEKNARVTELRQQYEEDLNLLAEENSLYRQELAEATAGSLYNLYQQDAANYEEMTNAEKKLIEGLKDAGITDFQSLDDALDTNFNNINTHAKNALNGVDGLWRTEAEELVKIWSGDTESIETLVNVAIGRMNTAVGEYNKSINELGNTAGLVFGYGDGKTGGLLKALEDAEQDTIDVKTEMGLLDEATGNFYTTLNDNLTNYATKMTEVQGAWTLVKDEIQAAIDNMNTYLGLKDTVKTTTTGDDTNPGDVDNTNPGDVETPGSENTDTGEYNDDIFIGHAGKLSLPPLFNTKEYEAILAPELPEGSISEAERIKAAWQSTYDNWDRIPASEQTKILKGIKEGNDQVAKDVFKDKFSSWTDHMHQPDISKTSSPWSISAIGTYGPLNDVSFERTYTNFKEAIDNLLKFSSQAQFYTIENAKGERKTFRSVKELKELQPFDTGGYTGSWNSASGRLALLHQKELVLNSSDTENILNVVALVRGISDKIKHNISSMMANIPVGNYGYNNISAAAATSGDVIINADFPNATDTNEIREALLSLPNLASQFISRRS